MHASRKLMLTGLFLLAGACGADPNEDSAAVENAMDAVENIGDATANAATPSPAETIFCRIVNRRISKVDCEDLTEAKSQVSQGVAAFNVPSPMTRDAPETITLVIDRRSPAEIAAIDGNDVENVGNAEEAVPDVADNAISMNAAGPVEPVGEPAPTPEQIVDPLKGRTESISPSVGQFMRADLTGDGFKIDALNPLSQEIPPGEQATWQWQVVPESGGTHSLTLRTVVEGEAGGKRYQLSGTPTTRTVDVEVSWGGKIADAMDATVKWLDRMKIVLVSLAGLLAAAWAVRRAWKGKSDDKAAAP